MYKIDHRFLPSASVRACDESPRPRRATGGWGCGPGAPQRGRGRGPSPLPLLADLARPRTVDRKTRAEHAPKAPWLGPSLPAGLQASSPAWKGSGASGDLRGPHVPNRRAVHRTAMGLPLRLGIHLKEILKHHHSCSEPVVGALVRVCKGWGGGGGPPEPPAGGGGQSQVPAGTGKASPQETAFPA